MEEPRPRPGRRFEGLAEGERAQTLSARSASATVNSGSGGSWREVWWRRANAASSSWSPPASRRRISSSAAVARVQNTGPSKPSRTSRGRYPAWSMWAWLTSTASSRRGSTGGGAQFRSRRARRPWNRPQSRSRRARDPWTRCFEPVTVPAAPRNCTLTLTVAGARPPARTDQGGTGSRRPAAPGRPACRRRAGTQSAPRARGPPPPDEAVDVQARLESRDLSGLDGGIRVPGHEERAAVGVGLDGGREGPDGPRLLRDLELVHPDERAQHRHRRHLVDPGQVLERLGGDLAKALAGDQRRRAHAPGQRLRDAHHEAPVHDHAGRRREGEDDLALDVAERHQEQPEACCHAVSVSTSSRALRREVSGRYGTLWKWTKTTRAPRFIRRQAATGESIPPESRAATVPPVPTGSPPGPGRRPA